MPRTRTDQPSVPTLLLWLKRYYAYIPTMIEEEKIYPKQGKEVARGLKHAIKALEDAGGEYRKVKRQEFENSYRKSQEYFEEV